MKGIRYAAVTGVAAASIFGFSQLAHAGTNDVQEIKHLLTETALEMNIPPEVLKAIAYKENKEFAHFDENGDVIISDDGGIGLMQLTFQPGEIEQYNIDMDRIKNDIDYHIEEAAKMLKRKTELNLPTVNGGTPEEIESWYFSVMAYNGLSEINDPNNHDDAYQEVVYDYIRNYSIMPGIGETPELDINYDEDSLIMKFGDRDYEWPTQTRSSQMFREGDVTYSYNDHEGFGGSNVRTQPINGDLVETIGHYTPLEVISGPYEAAGHANHYVFYEVKGNFGEGYIASSNLQLGNDLTIFSDLNGETEQAVAYLQHRGIINGYEDGTFRPLTELKRHQAAALVVRAFDLEKPADYQAKASDLTPDTFGYENLAIMEYHGYMGQGGKMNASAALNRSQMANILNRVFNDYYEQPASEVKIKDVGANEVIYENIAALVHNDITVANEDRAFNPWNTVMRSHYALFFERSVRLMEEKLGK
ncbi:S-layer homology domain-containing protein [Jeotgalibacillus malaysiensis]|uniref:S-layer homology domain-containing protein n=1 Tax=Jeotgalibacillus malaysiensis TaxID=1508404 RepID=UPI00384D1C44